MAVMGESKKCKVARHDFTSSKKIKTHVPDPSKQIAKRKKALQEGEQARGRTESGSSKFVAAEGVDDVEQITSADAPDVASKPAKSSSVRRAKDGRHVGTKKSGVEHVDTGGSQILSASKDRTKRALEHGPTSLKYKRMAMPKPVLNHVQAVPDLKTAEEEYEQEEEDQTAALLKGFESSSDSEDIATNQAPGATSFIVPAIPTSEALRKKLDAAASKSDTERSGVVYIGRIPHGFYEHEMRAYFSQFGDIKNLRLSRNRKTGASKHYAFIEFVSESVAKIVVQTMNNYLMFGHLLKVKLVPKEQVHDALFKNANKTFRKVPWNAIERYRLASTDRQGWSKRVEKEEKRRLEKAEKLKALGYEFEAPKLMQVADVPVRDIRDSVPLQAVNGMADVPLQVTEDAQHSAAVEEVTVVKQIENGMVGVPEGTDGLQMQHDLDTVAEEISSRSG